MFTKKELFKLVNKELEKYRINSQNLVIEKLNDVTKSCPEIKEINDEINQTSVLLAKNILNGNSDIDNSIEKIKKINLEAQNKIEKLLTENGYAKDYLDLSPHCKVCYDTGFLSNGDYCDCRKKIAGSIISKEFEKTTSLKLKDFKSFSLNYYSKDKDSNNISPYDQMSEILSKCISFAENFTPGSKGFILRGNTGLGKTHLSLAIANEVLKKGYNVVYLSSFELTKNLSNAFFNKNLNDDDFYYFLSEIDLLIIDDLGTEFETNFSLSSLYEIINKRILTNKSLIVSTNLSVKEIENRYNERIVSRLFSELTPLVFLGSDIRQFK